MKVFAADHGTHNLCDETRRVSRLRENLTSGSDGEGLETDLLVPRKPFTRQTAFDELKTHLKGARIILRSKTPELVLQECYGMLMAHFAIRGLMHEAALKDDIDPDCLSFVHAVRVVKRKMPVEPAFYFPTKNSGVKVDTISG
jgi:hypothetical protein